MATKASPKGEEQKKVPVTAPEAKDPLKVDKNVKKDDKGASKGGKEPPKDAKDVKKPVKDVRKGDPAQNRDYGRGRPNDYSRGRDRPRYDEKFGHREHEREVCRNFLNNRCDRGALCKFYHPRSPSRSRSGADDPSHKRSPVRAPGGEDGEGRVVCRDFLRNMCRRGDECRFYHPPPEPGSKKQQSSWLTFCHDFQNGHCTRSDCRFFHITKEDEELYRSTGEIAPQVVDQAVRKALVLDVALTGSRPTCKEFLKGICKMQNCRFKHLSQREYEDEVFHALQEEFEIVLGPPERRQSPSFRPIYSSLSNYHDPPPSYSTPPVDYRDDLLAPDDLRSTLLSHSDYEPEAKRPRYFSEEPAFSSRDDYGDSQRRWDDRIDYDRERLDFPSGETERMMQEIYHLRNDNMDMRRNLEQKISELREELATLMQVNEGLRRENAKIRTSDSEAALAHKADIEKLTVANNNLTQDCRKAQEALRRLELENGEIRKALEAKQKAGNVELEKKLETSGKELSQVRDSLTKTNVTLKKTQEEKEKVETELEGLKTKMQEIQTEMSRKNTDVSRKNPQSSNPPTNQRDDYHREQVGKVRPVVGLSELLHSERRGPDVRDQNMQNVALSGQDRFGSDVRGADGRNQYNQGYGMRTSSDGDAPDNQGQDARSNGDRSRPWTAGGPTPWPAPSVPPADSSHPRSQTYPSGYPPMDNHMRPQSSPFLRGPNYPPSSISTGLLKTPLDMPEYSSQSRPQGLSRGSENQYSSRGSENQYSSRGSESQYPSRGSENQYSSRGSEGQYPSRGSESQYPSRGSESQYPSRGSENQYSSRGSENQYSSQNVSRFEERDYSLSGYVSDARNQYGNPSRPLNSSMHWQKGTGTDGEGERGRGMAQPWNRRGKAMSNY